MKWERGLWVGVCINTRVVEVYSYGRVTAGVWAGQQCDDNGFGWGSCGMNFACVEGLAGQI